MPRVVVLGRIAAGGRALLAARPDLVIDDLPDAAEAEVAARVVGADAILIRTSRLSAGAIAGAPGLRVVSRHGVGYDNVDVAALTARGVPLTVVGDVNAPTVAEHTLFLLLALAKRGIARDRAVREGRWEERNAAGAVDLAGRRLLIVGLGRIGRRVAALAGAFGMAVEGFDPVAAPEPGVAMADDLDAALGRADAVTIHVPLLPATRNLFGAGRLARMKRGALLLCTARGGIVDEAALAAELRAGRLGGAGLDVFAEEPPAPDHPLFGLDSVVLSPHSAALTAECAARMSEVAARNVLAGLDGTLDPALVVNPEVLGR
jgi:D-3-phosphoglycerate dehydrogenase